MFVKIIATVLILIAVFMGVKQGYAMSSGKAEMMEMFGKWNFSRTALMVNGAITILGALLLLHPKTFLWGNFIMAAGILLIICFHAQDRDLKGMAIEVPFLLLNLIILYLQYPFKEVWQ